MKLRLTLVLISVVLVSHQSALAEQPIFDEMPRWKGGWGIQALQEFRTQSGLYSDNELISEDAHIEAHLFHLQGVYTWDKSIRLSIKAPFVIGAQRTIKTGGQPSRATSRGVGDVTVGLPLKRYFNLDGRSGNWGLTPQIKIPTAPAQAFDLYAREFGSGLTVGYGTETYQYLGHIWVTGYYFFGDTPANVFIEADVGRNYQLGSKNGHIKLLTNTRINEDGEVSFALGPIVYYRITDLWHAQLRTMHDLYRHTVGPLRFGKQHSYRLGLAVVF